MYLNHGWVLCMKRKRCEFIVWIVFIRKSCYNSFLVSEWVQITECIIFLGCFNFIIFILSYHSDILVIEVSRLILWFTGHYWGIALSMINDHSRSRFAAQDSRLLFWLYLVCFFTLLHFQHHVFIMILVLSSHIMDFLSHLSLIFSCTCSDFFGKERLNYWSCHVCWDSNI